MDTFEITEIIKAALNKAGRNIPSDQWSREEVKLLRQSPPFAALFQEYKIDQSSESWAWVMLVTAMASNLGREGFRDKSGPDGLKGWHQHFIYCVVETYMQQNKIKSAAGAIRQMVERKKLLPVGSSGINLTDLYRHHERGKKVFVKKDGKESQDFQALVMKTKAEIAVQHGSAFCGYKFANDSLKAAD